MIRVSQVADVPFVSLIKCACFVPHLSPQDVVDDIVESLVAHSALNATTLGALKNCEIRSLRLVGCRGVTDHWLEPFSNNPKNDCTLSSLISGQLGTTGAPPNVHPAFQATSQGHEDASSCSRSTSSFVSAISKVDAEADMHHDIVSAGFSGGLQDFMKLENKLFSLPSESAFDALTLLDLRGSQRLTDKGLLQLPDLPGLEVAKLDGCHAIIGRGLLAFSASHRLHTLSLQNCRRLTDEAIINVSHLVSLEALNLEGCRCLTDRSLAAIAGHYRLRKLDLSQCDLISDTGLGHLEGNEVLEEVSLGWCRGITSRGVDVFTLQPGRSERLKVFHLARCLVTDDCVEYLGRLSSLIELNLNGCSRIGSHALARTLERLPKLESLDISYCPAIL
jgi:Leucine Rich repeat